MGLLFDLEIPEIEDQPRNILPVSLFNLSAKDEVTEVEYIDKLEYVEFNIGINNKGIIKAFNKIRKRMT